MVRGATRSLAGSAASVARKVIGRGSSAPEPDPPAEQPVATKAPAKKASAEKSPASKAAAKKTSATRATAKKTPAPTQSKANTTKVTTAKSAAASAKAPAKKSATKTTTKKAAPKASTAALLKALVVKDGEDAWTKAELQEVIDDLHEAREHAVHLLEETEAGLDGLMRDAGDGAGHDQADMGATTFERDHELTVVNSERDKLAQIDRALARIDGGSYGECESCGEPIGKGRLMAFPRATLCMTCKQREERR